LRDFQQYNGQELGSFDYFKLPKKNQRLCDSYSRHQWNPYDPELAKLKEGLWHTIRPRILTLSIGPFYGAIVMCETLKMHDKLWPIESFGLPIRVLRSSEVRLCLALTLASSGHE